MCSSTPQFLQFMEHRIIWRTTGVAEWVEHWMLWAKTAIHACSLASQYRRKRSRPRAGDGRYAEKYQLHHLEILHCWKVQTSTPAFDYHVKCLVVFEIWVWAHTHSYLSLVGREEVRSFNRLGFYFEASRSRELRCLGAHQ